MERASTREREAWLGWAGVDPPRARRRAGVSIKAIIFVFTVLICMRFRMASTVARCIVSLGSKIRPLYSNWETSWIGYERGSEVGKGEYT